MENRENKIYKEYIWIMDNIKDIELRTPKGQYLLYKINKNSFSEGIPAPNNERLILQKLEEEGAIKIINSYGNDSYQ